LIQVAAAGPGALLDNDQAERQSAMARPIGKLHQEDVRRKIQVSQLLNVLQDHALNEVGEISPSRMKAIEILLRKSLPDLTAVTISGDEDNPLRIQEVRRTIVDPKPQ
jgi:hypothetical protein